MDGYLICNRVGTSLVHFSEIEEPLAWDELDFFSAKTRQDAVLALLVTWREIMCAGNDAIDYYWNDGATPFSRLEGAYCERGVIAPYSFVFADNTWYWFDYTKRFLKLEGRQPKIVSTPFDAVIQGYSDISDCMADLCEIKGRPWVILHFPTVQKTLVFDLMLKTWYEWGHWNSGTSTYERWWGNNVCFARGWNKWLVGSRLDTGEIWELDMDTDTDDGDEIRTLRRTALVDHGTLTRKFSKEVKVRVKRGEGFGAGSPSEVTGTDALIYTCIRDHTSTAADRPITGSNWRFYWTQAGGTGGGWVVTTAYDSHIPFLSFRWKDDNKPAWGNEHTLNLGKSGETEVVLSFKRLGIYKARQWEFILSDAVPLVLSDVEEEIEFLDGYEEEK